MPQDPPTMVDAVLLPWRDRVVYDGLIHSYGVSFGPGIRRSLAEKYQRIKASQGIIESLSRANLPTVSRHKKDGLSTEELFPTLDRIEQETARLKTAETTVQRSAIGVLRAAVDLARAAVSDVTDVDEIVRAGRRLNRAQNRLHTALDFD